MKFTSALRKVLVFSFALIMTLLVSSSVTAQQTKEVILFSNQADGNIYSIEPDGTNLVQLTSDGLNNVLPRISPDGTKIAFCKANKLHTMAPDGSNVVKLSDTVVNCNSNVNWSPDSSQLLLIADINATGSKLYVFDIATDVFTIVPTPGLSLLDQPDWSPDGSKFIISAVLDYPWNLFIQDFDGTGQQNIALYKPRLPAFSPDGSEVVYEWCCGGILRIVGADGSNDRSLNNARRAYSGSPRWSPDGNRIAFIFNFGPIGIINSDGSNEHVLPNAGFASSLDWGIVRLNSAPTADAGGPYVGDEGTPIDLSGAYASDEDGDALTYSWSAASSLCDFSSASVLSPTITCQDNGSFTITLAVSDGVNEPVSSSTTVEVANVAPTIDSIVAPSAPVNVLDQPVTVTATYSDPGAADTHAVTWEWGDLNHDTQSTASSPASQSHTYSEAGAYSVEVTVTDDDGGSDTATYEYVVIYDPEGGFVTGGGWIDSEVGWCQLDTVCAGAEGKANFGFVSKYKKGARVPTGSTQFNFKAGDLNFHSSEYDWLVVNQNGTNAQYKGSGTINGEGNYRFMLWASDSEADTFRIKIWYEDGSEVIVYDNGFDQPIGGGNIVVHTSKK